MALKSLRLVDARELSNGIALRFRVVTRKFSWWRLRVVERLSNIKECHCYRGGDWRYHPSGEPCSLAMCFALDGLYDTRLEQPFSDE